MATLGPPRVRLADKRFVELYLSNGGNQVEAYRCVFPDVCAKLTDDEIRREGNKHLKKKAVAEYMRAVQERLLFEARAADPLSIEKEETREIVAGSMAREMANAAKVDARNQPPSDPEVPGVAPAMQPLAVLHVELGRTDIVGQSVEIIKYSKEWCLQVLEANLARSLQIAPVVDAKGRPTGEYVYQGAVANKAIELIARMGGHLVDRKIVDHRGLADLSDDEIARKRMELRRRIAMERGEDIDDIAFTETRNG